VSWTQKHPNTSPFQESPARPISERTWIDLFPVQLPFCYIKKRGSVPPITPKTCFRSFVSSTPLFRIADVRVVKVFLDHAAPPPLILIGLKDGSMSSRSWQVLFSNNPEGPQMAILVVFSKIGPLVPSPDSRGGGINLLPDFHWRLIPFPGVFLVVRGGFFGGMTLDL